MPTYVFRAFFTKSKIGVAPSVAPVVNVCDSAGTLVVTDGAVTTLSGMVGLYGYSYTNATPGEYIALFRTTDTTVDLAQLPSWTPTVIVTNLDATVSSRNATTPPTAAAIADATWDEALSGHTTAGSAGAALTTSATDLLTNQVPGTYDPGSAGEALGKVLGISNAALYSPVSANNAMVLASGVQGGLRPSQQIIWLDSSGVAVDLSGATLTGWLRSIATGDVRAITGTLAVVTAASGIFSWTYSAADVADDGDFDVQFDAAFGSGATPARTIAAHWTVEASLA
jgi:hypothetical protein